MDYLDQSPGDLSGRLLDAAVVDFVFGWERVETRHEEIGLQAPDGAFGPDWKLTWEEDGPHSEMASIGHMPSFYSHQIEAAWGVVRYVMNNWEVIGFTVTESWQGCVAKIDPHPCRWPVEVVIGDTPLTATVDPREIETGQMSNEAWEKCAATAICRAALVAAHIIHEEDR